VYVADAQNNRVQKFTTSGVHLQTILSDMSWPRGLAVDSADNLYITEMHNSRVQIFDDAGVQIGTFGSYGSGVNKFLEPSGIAISPITGNIAVSDALNHRVQIFKPGVGIQNLNPSDDVLRMPDRLSLTGDFIDPATPGIDEVDSKLYFGDYVTSKFSVDITNSPDWSTVGSSTSVPTASKTYLRNLNTVDAPGVSATHSLYVAKFADQHSVYVCPNATSLAEVTVSCTGGYQLEEGAANLTTEVVDGITYWRIDGLTGTGALGLSITTPLSRLALTPDTSPVNATQEVTMNYTPTSGFVATDRIQIIFEAGAGIALANDCTVPTTDANGDATNDGSATIVDGNIYEYTFDQPIDVGPLTFCANVTAPSTPGSYSVRLSDDNGTFDATMYYVGNDTNVLITANVPPSLSFNLRSLDDTADVNTCAFGTISSSTPIPNYDDQDDGVQECGYSLAVGTNAPEGFNVQVTTDGPLNSTGANIANISNGGTFLGGVEAYGFANITAATKGRNPGTGAFDQSLTREGNFNLATDTATFIPSTPNTPVSFLSYTNGVEYMANVDNSDVTRVVHGLAVGSGTPAGYYEQVLHYTATANF
jgi:hypothetical protein